jgi:hypothetical protein
MKFVRSFQTRSLFQPDLVDNRAHSLEPSQPVASGSTSIYAIDEMLDDDDQDEIIEYFKSCDSSSYDVQSTVNQYFSSISQAPGG